MKFIWQTLNEFSKKCNRRINVRIFLVSLVVFMLFMALVLPRISETSRQITGTTDSPDTSFWYTAEDLYSIAEEYGEVGRAHYIRSRFTFDVVWPLAYGFFLLSALTMLYRSRQSGFRRKINLLPVAGVIFDYLENISASIVMFRFPDETPLIAGITPWFTLSKWLFIYASFLMLVFGVILAVVRWTRTMDSRRGRIVARILLALLLGAMLIFGGFLWYVNDYYSALPEAQISLESDEAVRIYETGNFIIFQPLQTESRTGFVFYPGGKVDELAYAPLLSEIAKNGITTVLVRMPYRIAFFGINRADEAIRLFPELSYWAVGGHSLGGAMSVRYANNHQDQINAVILWASYPDQNLSESGLDVLSIHGTRDGLIETAKIEETRTLLPAEAVFVAIEGGNHAQFGLYGEQEGDLPATISSDEQQRIIIDRTVDFLRTKAEK
jgi:hypothetical protein